MPHLAGPFEGSAALEDQIQCAHRHVRVAEEFAEQEGRGGEGRVRHHPERLLRPGERVQVPFNHADVAVTGETLAKPIGQPRVQLDRRHVTGPGRQGSGQPTVTCTDVDDVVTAADLRVLHDRASPAVTGEEVLPCWLTPPPP